MRPSGRALDALREIQNTRHFTKHAEGSVLIAFGDTQVLCTASVEEKVPPFLRGKNQGWLTAEYSMLPRATRERCSRESTQGRVGGRTHEIQRLIGRALRSVINLEALGDRTIWIDCDVLQADGGTRTASITGAFVAMADALMVLKQRGLIRQSPLRDFLAAVSVGIVNGQPVLDLDYAEDSKAEVDMNVVMTGSGKYIEVQGTAEGQAFSHDELLAMTELARQGIETLIAKQRTAMGMA